VLFRAGGLPDDPLAAAARFHAEALPELECSLRTPSAAAQALDPLVIVFAPGDHTHRGWRLAAVQELARKYAPRRINALASDDEAAIAAAATYLAGAPGVTGQLLQLDGNGAGEVLSP
jgi:hypothetical protein